MGIRVPLRPDASPAQWRASERSELILAIFVALCRLGAAALFVYVLAKVVHHG